MVAPATWHSKRFELTRHLGAGGFGVVYAARDRERGGVVALKSLSRLEPRHLLRFKREFRALADVDHPHLVAPFELLEEYGEWFFTMPLVEGVDLLTWVRGRGPETIPTGSTERLRVDALTATMDAEGRVTTDAPPEAEVKGSPAPPSDLGRLYAIVPQLVLGVGALHQHGLIHRDLKPSNVLVDTTGRVRILDFGLVAPRSTRDEAVLGTPAYMAPEQARGMAVNEAADWYAVGVMLYECLTGVLPFEGPLLQVIVAKQTRDAPRASVHFEAIPRELDDLCAALLSRDPATRPRGPEILRCLGTPVVGSGPALSSRPKADVLVGRHDELVRLRAAFDSLSSESGAVVRVEGISGAGKSVLVGAFTAGCGDAALVLSGRCYEQERVPFVALDGVIDAIAERLGAMEADPPPQLEDLARIFPVLGSLVDPNALRRASVSAQEARRRAATALRSVLGHLAAERRVVVQIDDAQWGDSDSAALLIDLIAGQPIPNVLLVLTHRSEAGLGGAFLAPLEEAGVFDDASVVSLGPLTMEEATELASSVLGGEGADQSERARQIALEAGGHAMFVHELAHHEYESVHPPSLDAMIDTRVARLDPPSQALLEIVAVAGAPLPREVVEKAAGVGDASVATERSLRAGRFVRASGRRGARLLSPYHDRIREVTVGRLDDAARTARHLAIADALEAGDVRGPELLSRHLHEGGAHDRAIPYTLEAAERATEALAFERAVALYERAVAHTPEGHPDHGRRTVALAEALVEAGRGTEAAALFVRAAESVEEGEAAALRRRAVEQWIRAGRLEEGLDALEDALRSLGLPSWSSGPRALFALVVESMRASLAEPRGAPRTEAEVDPLALARMDLLFSVGTALSLVDPARGMAFTRRATRLAFTEREPRRVMRGFVQNAIHVCARGTRTEEAAHAHLSRARELADSIDDPLEHAMVDIGEAYVGFLCGRFVRSAELAYAAEPRIRERGATYKWELEAGLRGALKGDTFTGELARIRARVIPLLADATATRDLFSEVGLSIRFMYLIALMDDDPDRATAILDQGIARWSGRKPFLQHWLESMARIEVALYRGEGEGALREIEARWPAIVKTHTLRSQYGAIESRHMRARAALAAGDLALAEKMAARMSREPAGYAVALAESSKASALYHRDPEAAHASFVRAAALLDEECLRLFAAAARARVGTLSGDGAAVEEAHATIRAEGVRQPERFVYVYAPISPAP